MYSHRKSVPLIGVSDGIISPNNEWWQCTNFDRPTEIIALDEAIHISYGDNDIVDYPIDEIASICRYFLRVHCNYVFDESIYDDEYSELWRHDRKHIEYLRSFGYREGA